MSQIWRFTFQYINRHNFRNVLRYNVFKIDTILCLNVLFLQLVGAIGSLILTLRSTTRQAWRCGLQNFKNQFEFKHLFYDAPPRRYSSPEMIVVSELKSTLWNSSHLSTISRRSEDMKMLRVALFTKRGRRWKYFWDYKLFILFFFYEEFFYIEGRLVDFSLIMIILIMQHWISKCKNLNSIIFNLSFLSCSTYSCSHGTLLVRIYKIKVKYYFYQVSEYKLILVLNYSKRIWNIKVEYAR